MDAVGDDLAHFGVLMLGAGAQGGQQRGDGAVAQPVQHALAVAARLHQAGAAQVLQMLGRIGDAQSGQFGQPLHGALALGHVFQQDQPVGMAQGLGDLGQRLETLGGRR